MDKVLKDLPFINLSKENLILLKDMYEEEDIGKIMLAIINYIYFGIEPSLPKILIGGYNQLMYVIERKAAGYFAKVEAGKKNLDKHNKRNKEYEPKEIEEKEKTPQEMLEEENNRIAEQIKKKREERLKNGNKEN